MPRIRPTGQEIFFAKHELIVSKTDERGIITYANDIFMKVSGYGEEELLGQPHNLIRHPEMPGCVFKLAWDTLKTGREIFAYVVNLSKNGGHYWVFAHMTPSWDSQGRCVGYHSNRRVPSPDALAEIKKLYSLLLAEEDRHAALGRTQAVAAGSAKLTALLREKGLSYDEFAFRLSRQTTLEAAIA